MKPATNRTGEQLTDTEGAALLIRRTGARATPARVRVLRLLRSAPTALTHHEIEQALGDLALDRVTLYRVLDWLVASGCAPECRYAANVSLFRRQQQRTCGPYSFPL